MLKATCNRPPCSHMAVNRRQYSPWAMRYGTNAPMDTSRGPVPPMALTAPVSSSARNSATLMPMRTLVTGAPPDMTPPEAPQRARIWPRVTTLARGQIRSRWGASGGVMSGGAPVTKVLIGINVALFLAELLTGAVSAMGGTGPRLVSMGALVPYLIAHGEYWRLFTAMWLHGSLLHVAFNMYALYIGGSYLEMIAGKGKYLAIYLVAGVAGNVFVFVLAPLTHQAFTPTIGASTAIFGIFGALFTYSLHNRDSAVGRALSSMGTVILINLVITFVVPGISWQGHIGGLVGGVLCVEALTRFGQRDLRSPFGPRDAALLAVIAAVLVVAVLWRTANFPLA